MALVVVVISVVMIEIRTVIGGRYQREGPFVVLGVQWFLLNADVVPGRGGESNKINMAPVPLSLTLSDPFFPFITFHTCKQKRPDRPVLIQCTEKETGEQKQMSGCNETVSGGLTGADDNFSFLLRYSNPGEAAGFFFFIFSWQPTTGYSLRIDK